jgi:hypothetical protein
MEKRLLQAGDRRRMSDGRNAWRKMTPDQRHEFLTWQFIDEGPDMLLPAEIGETMRQDVARRLRFRISTFYPCISCGTDTRYRNSIGHPHCGGC